VLNVVGLILAAGQSSRMGHPKALLPSPHTGLPFVRQLILSLQDGGLGRIGVVGRQTDDGLRRAIAGAGPHVDFVENPSPELGQLSSLLAGLEYAEAHGAAGALVVPVDMPLIKSGTVRAAVAAFVDGGQPMLRVTHRGEHGHPVIFGARMFPALRDADPSLGARAVIRQDPSRVHNLEVDDPGVLRDIDLPEEYRRLFEDDPD